MMTSKYSQNEYTLTLEWCKEKVYITSLFISPLISDIIIKLLNIQIIHQKDMDSSHHALCYHEYGQLPSCPMLSLVFIILRILAEIENIAISGI